MEGNTREAWVEIELSSSESDDEGASNEQQTPVQPFENGDTNNPGNFTGDRKSSPELPNNHTSTSDPITEQAEQYKNKSHLSFLIKVWFYLGLCPINPKKQCPKCCVVSQWIVFILLGLISIIQSLDVIKYQILHSKDEDEKLLHYVILGYFINTFIFRCYYLYIMTIKQTSVLNYINSLEHWDYCQPQSSVIQYLTVAFCVLPSVILAIIIPILDTISHYEEWDIEDIILYRSAELADTLFLWEAENLRNSSLYNSEHFGTNICPTTVVMGVISFSIEIGGTFANYCCKDLTLISAYSLYTICHDFSKQLRNSNGTDQNVTAGEKLWTNYKHLRLISEQLDEAMGHHTKSILLQMCQLLKLIMFYVLSAKASNINSTFRKWIQMNFRGVYTPFTENCSPVSTNSILEELASDPIGVGTNMFFIDSGFIWKFSSVVGSYFFFFTESSEGSTSVGRR